MTPAEQKQAFIQLRAEGLSYRRIHEQIGVSRSTCSRWEEKLRAQIAQRKAQQLNDLYEAYSMTKEGRIKTLGETVKRIQLQIDKTDLSQIPPDKLLDLHLKYTKALQDEYIAPADPIQITHPRDLLMVLEELINRIRSGEITEEQARRESTAVNTLIKAYETIELKTKLEALEALLQERYQDEH